MVNGIFTIPLGGLLSGTHGVPGGAAPTSTEFIAGPEHRLAACALWPYLDPSAVPASPLVFYGPHGVGKSHLARGLVARWQEQFPQKRVHCLPGAEFAREHASAIADHHLESWRAEMGGWDLFVLEDLGQLTSKRSSQQELVRVLDALADCEARVVITARTLPTHSHVFIPALRSRLSAGLAVPLSLPGPPVRRAVLEDLAAVRGLSLSRRAIQALADGLVASMPELVAALLELDLRARSAGGVIGQRQVREFVVARDHARIPALRDIACLTAKYFDLSLAELKNPRRRQSLVAARAVAMYLSRQLTGKSFAEIGAYFGGRDHTTVLHGCRRTEQRLARDRTTRTTLAELKRLLHAS